MSDYIEGFPIPLTEQEQRDVTRAVRVALSHYVRDDGVVQRDLLFWCADTGWRQTLGVCSHRLDPETARGELLVVPVDDQFPWEGF